VWNGSTLNRKMVQRKVGDEEAIKNLKKLWSSHRKTHSTPFLNPIILTLFMSTLG